MGDANLSKRPKLLEHGGMLKAILSGLYGRFYDPTTTSRLFYLNKHINRLVSSALRKIYPCDQTTAPAQGRVVNLGHHLTDLIRQTVRGNSIMGKPLRPQERSRPLFKSLRSFQAALMATCMVCGKQNNGSSKKQAKISVLHGIVLCAKCARANETCIHTKLRIEQAALSLLVLPDSLTRRYKKNCLYAILTEVKNTNSREIVLYPPLDGDAWKALKEAASLAARRKKLEKECHRLKITQDMLPHMKNVPDWFKDYMFSCKDAGGCRDMVEVLQRHTSDSDISMFKAILDSSEREFLDVDSFVAEVCRHPQASEEAKAAAFMIVGSRNQRLGRPMMAEFSKRLYLQYKYTDIIPFLLMEVAKNVELVPVLTEALLEKNHEKSVLFNLAFFAPSGADADILGEKLAVCARSVLFKHMTSQVAKFQPGVPGWFKQNVWCFKKSEHVIESLKWFRPIFVANVSGEDSMMLGKGVGHRLESHTVFLDVKDDMFIELAEDELKSALFGCVCGGVSLEKIVFENVLPVDRSAIHEIKIKNARKRLMELKARAFRAVRAWLEQKRGNRVRQDEGGI